MRETAGVIAPPPLIALAAIVAGLVLQWLLPIPMLPALAWAGWPLLAGGIALAVWAERAFKAAGTPAMPWKPTVAITASGPYRFSRNPMYVGLLAAQLGTGLVLHNPWIAALSVATALVLHHGVVLREERYLSAKFGEPYETYRRATRRWL
jgi:protein-S-isoprenylcysteine O-methyltransferase Ste14